MAMMRSWRILVIGAAVALVGCREQGDTGDKDVVVAPECATYLEKAKACADANEGPAKHAVHAVYSANARAVDQADSPQKMESLVESCQKWDAALAKHPRCKK